MKIKIMLLILLVFIALPVTYIKWPQLTQNYRPGTCVMSKSTNEVFLVESFGDNIKGRGPRAKIIKANVYAQHKPGDIIYIVDGDKNLKKVDCDQNNKKLNI